MKMAGSSWSTLLLFTLLFSKIGAACSGPPESIFEAKNAEDGFGAALRAALGGTLLRCSNQMAIVAP